MTQNILKEYRLLKKEEMSLKKFDVIENLEKERERVWSVKQAIIDR